MKILPVTILMAALVIAHAAQGGMQGGDAVVPGCDPPARPYVVNGGNCGEACLWTIFHARGMEISQEEINRAGGNPGRGLYSHELVRVLGKYGVRYRNRSRRTSAYRSFIMDDVLPCLRQGRPVLLGVKVYPDTSPAWSCDHFILAVGYNLSSQELIINDVERRDRISFEQLISTSAGYSIASSHRYVFAIEIR